MCLRSFTVGRRSRPWPSGHRLGSSHGRRARGGGRGRARNSAQRHAATGTAVSLSDSAAEAPPVLSKRRPNPRCSSSCWSAWSTSASSSRLPRRRTSRSLPTRSTPGIQATWPASKGSRSSAHREAGKTGLTPQEYRDEVRRQILEGKLLQLRVRAAVRLTEDDVKATYTRLSAPNEPSSITARLDCLRVPPERSSPPSPIVKALGERSRPPRAPASTTRQQRRVRRLGDELLRRHPHPLRRRRHGHPQARRTGRPSRRGLQARSGWRIAPLPLQERRRDASRWSRATSRRSRVRRGPRRGDAAHLRRADGQGAPQWIDELRHGTYVDVRL